MSYLIRKITKNEYDRLYELILEFADFISSSKDVKVSSKQLAEDSDKYECLVIDHNDSLVGYAIYYFAYSSWSGKILYLEDLYIQATHQSQGVGSNVFDFLETLATTNECKKMKWQVSDWNDKAQAFYISKGASVGGSEINCEKWV